LKGLAFFQQALIKERIESLDYEAAKTDVRGFLVDPRTVDVWSPEFFREMTNKIKFV